MKNIKLICTFIRIFSPLATQNYARSATHRDSSASPHSARCVICSKNRYKLWFVFDITTVLRGCFNDRDISHIFLLTDQSAAHDILILEMSGNILLWRISDLYGTAVAPRCWSCLLWFCQFATAPSHTHTHSHPMAFLFRSIRIVAR